MSEGGKRLPVVRPTRQPPEDPDPFHAAFYVVVPTPQNVSFVGQNKLSFPFPQLLK